MIQMQTVLEAADNSGAKKSEVYQSPWRIEKTIRKGWRHHRGINQRQHSQFEGQGRRCG